jgi:phage portal protein BeeE
MHFLDRAEDYVAKLTDRTRNSLRAGGGSAVVASPTRRVNSGMADTRRETALRLSERARGWVFSAVRPIASRIAGQPIRLARMNRDGVGDNKDMSLTLFKDFLPPQMKAMADVMELVPSHPALKPLYKPNSFMTQWSLIWSTVFSLEVTGEAFWLVDDTKDGKAIYPLPSSWMAADHSKELYGGWECLPRNTGEPHKIPADMVVYFRYPDWNDPLGVMSPMEMQNQAIASDMAIQTAQQRSFQNGIFPGVMLTVGKTTEVAGVSNRPKLTADQRRDIINAIKAQYRGVLRYDEPLILDALIEKAEPFTRTNQEMAYLESGKLTKARIFQGFGVNEFIAGELQGVNRATAVVADDNFCTNVVNPKLELISQILTQFYLPMFAGTEGLIAYVEPARPNDPEMRLKERDQQIKSGSLTRNELRKIYGYPPLPGKAGDTIILMPGQAIVPSDVAEHDARATGVAKNKPPAAQGRGSETKPAANESAS